MTFESLVSNYGYWAILLGTFLEGETILIIGGFAAHQGYLQLPLVIAAALAGSLAGDQLSFFIGRLKGKAFLEKHPSLKGRADKVNRLLERYQNILALGFRFLYGLRNVTPFAIGMSRMQTLKFCALNVIGALTWAALVGTGGYLFGAALEAILGKIKHLEMGLALGMGLVGCLFWTIHFYRNRKRREKPDRVQ